MKSLMEGIAKAETEVRAATLEKYGKEFKVIEESMEFIIDQTNLFSYKKLEQLGALQAARIHLIVRSLNSVRMATGALALGYYQQALTLLRMVAEDQLVARDVIKHAPTLDALMNNPARIDKFSTMAQRQSSEFEKHWKDYYGMLSAYGAHPRPESIFSLAAFSPTEGVRTVQPGPFYDEDWIQDLLRITRTELKEMVGAILELLQQALRDETDLDRSELNWTQEDILALIKNLSTGLHR